MPPASSREYITEKIRQINQLHVFDNWDDLTLLQKERVFRQIERLDSKFFLYLRRLLTQGKSVRNFEPPSDFVLVGSDGDYCSLGNRLLQEKKVACIVLAGGQGSRLKYDAPKGFFPVSPVKKKSLFQLIAEKTKSASKWANQDLPLAFMVSPLNADKIVSYFRDNDYFGLNPSQVDFFCQPLWPLLDGSGNLFFEECDKIAFGPNGNGCVAKNLFQSPIYGKWREMGVEMASIIPIDNPLGLPFDADLFGFHNKHRNDVTIKASFRQTPKENVGILARQPETGKTIVIEYFEISDEQRFSLNSEETLTYPIANIGLYCLSMDFIKKVHHVQLPIYKNKKSAKIWNRNCDDKNQSKIIDSWKFEEFVFDLFTFADKCGTLVYPRAECFAPLKNLEGNDSLITVHQALSQRERQLFQDLTGVELSPNATFELDADFYYPSALNSVHQWRKKAFFEESFIEAL
ncbi:MAG: UTP--glucose-1-phosphate uridylyltransferase [Victivallaceae bacterium]